MKPIERVIRNILNDFKYNNKTTDEAVEMLTDMVENLSSINTQNKKGLDDNLREKVIEQPDNQEVLSNKKDRLYTDKDMEAIDTVVKELEKQKLPDNGDLNELFPLSSESLKCDVCGCIPSFVIRTQFGTFCQQHARYV